MLHLAIAQVGLGISPKNIIRIEVGDTSSCRGAWLSETMRRNAECDMGHYTSHKLNYLSSVINLYVYGPHLSPYLLHFQFDTTFNNIYFLWILLTVWIQGESEAMQRYSLERGGKRHTDINANTLSSFVFVEFTIIGNYFAILFLFIIKISHCPEN